MWWRPVLEMDVSGGGWKVIVNVRGDCDLRCVKKMYEEDVIYIVLFVIGFMWWRPVLEMDVSGGGWKVIVTVRGDCDLSCVKKMYEEDVNDEERRC